MKKLSLKKLEDGPHAGHHGVFDADEPLGFIDAGEFADYARQHLDDGAGAANGNGNGTEDASADCAGQKLAERLGVAPSTTFDEIRRRLEAADQAQGTEAGGRASDLAGRPFKLLGSEIFTSNGVVHQEMCQVFSEVIGGRAGG